MRSRHTSMFIVAFAMVIAVRMGATAPDGRVDLDALYRFKEEGFLRSAVMETASYLTDVYGPRLTGSPITEEAAAWAERQLARWVLVNVRRETFPFGRGWQNHQFVASALSPRAYPLHGFAKAWTAGTDGVISGEVVRVRIASEQDFGVWRGKLRGKIVLPALMRAVTPIFDPLASRFSDGELAALAKQPPVAGRGRGTVIPNTGAFSPEFIQKRLQFFADERVAAVIEPSIEGDGGTIFVQGAPGALRNLQMAMRLPQIVLAIEHYGRIWRTLDKNIPVTLQLDIRNEFTEGPRDAFNVLAEIPGTDKADEVVMLGAHFDSWHTGTGATDNAAGVAVMMEAMRILKATGVPLHRTVRLALWGGEEQGLLGSRAYVRRHFGDPETMQLTPDHAKLSAYYNLDNGTGAIRGVYLQGNEAVAPIFKSWMAPLENLGMTTLAIRGTTNTDHTSFDAVGLPGFQFIQDPIEYHTRTHHSNQDVYERLQPDDLMRNAVIVATFAYHTANRDEPLPRKPLPPPTRRAPDRVPSAP